MAIETKLFFKMFDLLINQSYKEIMQLSLHLISLIIVSFAIYLLPLMIAIMRDHINAVAISALNILSGIPFFVSFFIFQGNISKLMNVDAFSSYTFIGWVVAFVWSLAHFEPKKH